MNDPLLTTVISVFASIVTTVATLFIKDTIETRNSVRRMMLGMCIECAGTVRAFKGQTDGLQKGLGMLKEKDWSFDTDRTIFRTLPSGFIVSPPMQQARELANLLPTEHARAVFHWFDSWERYTASENDYRKLFETLLDTWAKAQIDEKDKRYYELLREERLEELRVTGTFLYEAIHSLMAFCCEILLASPEYLDQWALQSVDDLTNGEWNTWQEIRDACKEYHAACQLDGNCPVS